jgi:hypothetical protein
MASSALKWPTSKDTVAVYGDIHTEYVIVCEGKLHSFWNAKTGGVYSYRHVLEVNIGRKNAVWSSEEGMEFYWWSAQVC